jgi:hypothetical protein
MEQKRKKPEERSREEFLAPYERGVTIALLVVAAAICALILWLGWMFFTWGT